QAHVRRVVVAAGRGTSRPADGQRPRVRQESLEILCQRHRPALGIDERQVAEIRPRARDEAALDGRWIVREVLQEWLWRQRAETGVCDVREDDVLGRREA